MNKISLKAFLISILLAVTSQAHADSLRRVYRLGFTCATSGCLSSSETGLDYDNVAHAVKVRATNELTLGTTSSIVTTTGRSSNTFMTAPAYAFSISTTCLIHPGKQGIWRNSSGMQQRNADGSDTPMGFGSPGTRPSVSKSTAAKVSQIEFIQLVQPPTKTGETALWLHSSPTMPLKVRGSGGGDTLIGCNDENKCTRDVLVGSVCHNVNYATCGYPACSFAAQYPGCSNPDTDNDGLNDAWETAGGIDLNCDGVIDGSDFSFPNNQLPTVGVRDIYLRIRAMGQDPGTGGGCASDDDCASDFVGPYCDLNAGQCSDEPSTGHAPAQNVIDMLVAAFVPHNIAVHVDYNQSTSATLPHVTFTQFYTADACGGNTPFASFFGSNDVINAVSPNPIKGGGFGISDDPRDLLVWHNVVFVHSWCTNPGITGVSENIVTNNSIVSLGSSTFGQADPFLKVMQAGTSMHEFGHQLGLTHYYMLNNPLNTSAGRPKNVPHYLSVMNYRYQLSGISQVVTPVTDTVPNLTIAPNTQRIDYSSSALMTLNEGALDENAGVGPVIGSNDAITYNCPLGPSRVGWAGGSINWNCNGSIDSSVSAANIDGDISTDPTPDASLPGKEDWSTLNFNMQCGVGFNNP